MKNYIFIFSIAILLITCSKKNNTNPLTPLTTTDASLAGKWNAVVDSSYTIQDGVKQVTIAQATTGTYYQFNNNGTGFLVHGGSTSDQGFVYTITKGVIQLIFQTNEYVQPPEYFAILAITQNKLILSVVSGTITEDIVLVK